MTTQYNLYTTRIIKDKDGKTYKQWGIIESFQDKDLAEKELALMRKRYPKRDWRIDESFQFSGLGNFLPLITPN